LFLAAVIPKAGGMSTRTTLTTLRKRLLSPWVIAPIALGAGILAIWQAGVFHLFFNIKPFTLPYPDAIAREVSASGTDILDAISVSLPAALTGYFSGMLIGFFLGSALVRFGARLMPYVVPVLSSSNAVPIVALAPVLALWIADTFELKVVVVTVMTVPTMVIYTVRGLLSVEPNALELMESLEASPNQVYRMLRLPQALPFLLTALKSAVVLALIGVIVTETIRGGFQGLGYVIAESLSRFDAARAWLALLVIAAIGITWYIVTEVVERLALPWEQASRVRR
jgi:NitT/TauT family transport system permease protein